MRQRFTKPPAKKIPVPVSRLLSGPGISHSLFDQVRQATEQANYLRNERERRELDKRRKELTLEQKLENLANDSGATPAEAEAARKALRGIRVKRKDGQNGR